MPMRQADPPVPFVVELWQRKRGENFPGLLSRAVSGDSQAMQILRSDLEQFRAGAKKHSGSSNREDIEILANTSDLSRIMMDSLAYASATIR